MDKMKERYSLKEKVDTSYAYVANVAVIALIFFSIYAYFFRTVISPFVSMVIVYILVFFIIKCLSRYFKGKKHYDGALSYVDDMSPEEFVNWLKGFFENNGFAVKATQRDPQFGISLIMVKKSQIRRAKPETYIVQAKRYTSDVDLKSVQKALAAQHYYNIDHCIICTNQYYTDDAMELAKSKGVTLMNRDHVYKIKMQEVA